MLVRRGPARCTVPCRLNFMPLGFALLMNNLCHSGLQALEGVKRSVGWSDLGISCAAARRSEVNLVGRCCTTWLQGRCKAGCP